MEGGAIHDDGVSWRQFWQQAVFDPMIEKAGIRVAFKDKGRDQLFAKKTRYQADTLRFLSFDARYHLRSAWCSGILPVERILNTALINVDYFPGVNLFDLS